MERESMQYDVVIIGAGPAGLSAAIRLAQLNQENNQNFNICVLEKGAEVGAHILSGAVFEPHALNELIPDWQSKGAPLNTPVSQDEFYYLSKQKALKLPTPPSMKNQGNYIISLGRLCAWLAEQAEALGVEIFPGFAASQFLEDDQGKVIGVQTGDMGLDKNNQPKSTFQAGVNIFAKYTLFAEGCRGHLAQQVIEKFKLRENKQPQTYGIGLKELWEIDPKDHQLGKVIHTIGWPLDPKTYGGSFLYHLENNQISLGFVVGLDYKNPYLSPFQEFQRFKHHPFIQSILNNGQMIRYGARALNEGGWQSLPKLHFPGGLLLGCSAGFLNVAKIKGSHLAMKSGMLAAQSAFEALQQENAPSEIKTYCQAIHKSWIKQELYQVRNIRPSFKWGLWPGMIYSAFDYVICRGKCPWTFKHHADHLATAKASECKPIEYPKPDGKISFDRLSALSKSNVYHEEDQPCHLRIQDQKIPTEINYNVYAHPETRYCPAGVYEYVEDENQKPKLQINAQNCIHCKTCDIKDPKQNIQWVVPEGTGGPNYTNM